MYHISHYNLYNEHPELAYPSLIDMYSSVPDYDEDTEYTMLMLLILMMDELLHAYVYDLYPSRTSLCKTWTSGCGLLGTGTLGLGTSGNNDDEQKSLDAGNGQLGVGAIGLGM